MINRDVCEINHTSTQAVDKHVRINSNSVNNKIPDFRMHGANYSENSPNQTKR